MISPLSALEFSSKRNGTGCCPFLASTSVFVFHDYLVQFGVCWIIFGMVCVNADFATAIRIVPSLSLPPAMEVELAALEAQATRGPNKASRPSSFNIKGCLKHDAWLKLQKMSKQKAKTQYILTVRLLATQHRSNKSHKSNVADKENKPVDINAINCEEKAKEATSRKEQGESRRIVEAEFYQRYLS